MRWAVGGVACLLAVLAPVAAWAQHTTACPVGRDNGLDFPFFGMAETGVPQEVTIYADASAKAFTHLKKGDVEGGADRWNDSCSTGGATFSRLPHFRVDWASEPPQGMDPGTPAWRTSLVLKVQDAAAPVLNGAAHPAEWSSRRNEITLYTRCPVDGTFGLPCQGGPNTAIKWETPGFTETVIAHEIGHPLGLADEKLQSGCFRSIMGPIPEELNPIPPIYFAHCQFVDKANDPNEECNTQEPGPGETHPCESAVTKPQIPAGPGGTQSGSGQDFASAIPWLDNPWTYFPSCTYQCETVTVTDPSGSESTRTCAWRCDHSAVLPGGESVPPEKGAAPVMYVANPGEGETVSGSLTVSGWAMDFIGLARVTYGVDGAQVPVTGTTLGTYELSACRPPLGVRHSACNPYSGFSARLDTRLLSNGPHTLQVVADDVSGFSSIYEREIVVDNTSPPPPVTLTFTPRADTFVHQLFPDSNYGGAPHLRVRSTVNGRGKYSFLDFPVSGVGGPVTEAKLRVRVQDQPIGSLWIYRICSSGWNESAITWNNWPQETGGNCGLLGTLYNLQPETWYEFDVSGYVAGNGGYSFGLAGDDNVEYEDLYSRDSPFPPQLVVAYQP